MNVAKIISETKLEEMVKESETNNTELIIDFFATWCGPCQVYMPIFDLVNSKNENWNMVKVDIDTISEEVARKYSINAVPTTLIIKNGKIENKTQGFMSEEQLTNLIKENIK